MNKFSSYLKFGVGLVLACLIGGAAFAFGSGILSHAVPQVSPKLGTVSMISDRVYQDSFGTASAPVTLTSAYVTSTALHIHGLSNIVVAGTYLPKSQGSILYMIIERSLDNGQTYQPFDNITPSTDRVSVYSNQFATSSNAVPFQIPGSGVSTSGTSMGFSFDETLAADYIRLSVKESTTSTFGTVNVQLLTVNH